MIRDAVDSPLHLSYRYYRRYIFLPPIFDVVRTENCHVIHMWHDGIDLRYCYSWIPSFSSIARCFVRPKILRMTNIILQPILLRWLSRKWLEAYCVSIRSQRSLVNSDDEPWMPRRNAKNSYTILDRDQWPLCDIRRQCFMNTMVQE